MAAIELDAAFLARFEILSEVSSGGTGVVYRAHQRSLDREVAVKFPLLGDPDILERFDAEARVLASLDHPCVVRVIDWGRVGSRPYLVEELVEGDSLEALLARRGRLPEGETLPILQDVAGALAHIHAQGVVHRDLKPGNVLLAAAGAKLIDFGFARARAGGGRTQAGVLLGTPQYMAPEVLSGARAEPPADVYALGTMAFVMLAGRLPIEEQDLAQSFVRRLRETAPRVSVFCPSVSQGLDELVAAMLEAEPSRRPTASEALLPRLEALLTSAGRSAPLGETLLSMEVLDERAAPVSPARPSSARRPNATLGMPRPEPGGSRGRVAAATRSMSRLPAASVAGPAPTARRSRFAWAALPLLFVGALLTGYLMTGQGPDGASSSREPGPAAASPGSATPMVSSTPARIPPAVPPADLERLLAGAERAPNAVQRLEAFYRVAGRAIAGGAPAAGSAARIEESRERLLPRVGLARAGAVAAMLKLLEGAPARLSTATRHAAARDFAERYGLEAVEALSDEMAALDIPGKAISLSTSCSERATQAVALLESTRRQFGGTPGGRLWLALAAHVPRLLADRAAPLELRQQLAYRIQATAGLELLYRRYALVPPIGVESSLAPMLLTTSRPLEPSLAEGIPAHVLLARAGLQGTALNLVVNRRGDDSYLHRDAQAWYLGAMGRGDTLPPLKESSPVGPLTLPPSGSSPTAAEVAFLAWTRDHDPEDAFSLELSPASRKGPPFRVLLLRGDGPRDGLTLCVTRVRSGLLPAGEYTGRLQPVRLLMHRKFLESQGRMTLRLARLVLAAP